MKKKVVSLKRALLFNFEILLCVGILLFGAEIRVASEREKQNLLQKTESMRQSFVSVHYQTTFRSMRTLKRLKTCSILSFRY